jgi:hypothetical protein
MKRILVISLVVLGVYAEGVNAECAWVLWEGTVNFPDPAFQFTYKPIRAFEKQAPCSLEKEVSLKQTESNFRKIVEQTQYDIGSVDRSGDSVFVMGLQRPTNAKTIFTYSCLPDTIDPRSKK